MSQLLAYGAHQFQMNRPAPAGGGALADHYASAARARGWAVPAAPELPQEARHVWNAFARLHRSRGSDGIVPAPISWSELDAFCRLTASPLDPWEVDAVMALDAEWFRSRSEGGT